ncbi:MAG: hypothetical protein LC126_29395 [Bryobacterales bacterium]|nr:hypothetical protein [Bryobacterales bacterium]
MFPPALILSLLCCSPLPAAPRIQDIVIRGKHVRLRHYVSAAGDPRKVILASGDGGWKGFEKKIASTLAVWGYDVYGLNTREYLRRFTHQPSLTAAEVPSDFQTLIRNAGGSTENKVILMGWSAGAALVVLAGAEGNKNSIEGVAAVSLPESAFLAWRWWNSLAFLPCVKETGPTFSTLPYVPRVAPLPLMIIQSAKDHFVPEKDRNLLFSAAIQPRRRIFLHAGGHSFPGARKRFFEELKIGLEWVQDKRRDSRR